MESLVPGSQTARLARPLIVRSTYLGDEEVHASILPVDPASTIGASEEPIINEVSLTASPITIEK